MKPIEALGVSVLFFIMIVTVAVVRIRVPIILEEARQSEARAEMEHKAEAARELETEQYMRSIGCVTLDCAISKSMKQ